MKTIIAIVAASLLPAVGLPQGREFTGEIMDSPCAGMHSHERMMKGVDAKDARECSQKCARMGMKYVLYDPATKAIYQVDDQGKAAAFAGQKVTIKGTVDAAGKALHVESIQAR
jgi:hypothetical protein